MLIMQFSCNMNGQSVIWTVCSVLWILIKEKDFKQDFLRHPNIPNIQGAIVMLCSVQLP